VYIQQYSEVSHTWITVEMRENTMNQTSVSLNVSSFGAWRVQMGYERAYDHLSTFTCQRNEYLNSLNDCIYKGFSVIHPSP